MTRSADPRVAVVGAGCALPGGISDPDGLWRALREGVDATGPMPPTRWDLDALHDPDPSRPDRSPVRTGAFLDDVSGFDAGLFRTAPPAAAATDPQQRLLLEVFWSALEHANIAPDSLRNTDTGVYVGLGTEDYSVLATARPPDAHALLGLNRAMAAGRVAHLLGTRGPALQVDTTCSSGLVATHLAVRDLRSGDCDVALVGGAHLLLTPWSVLARCRTNALSPTGACRAFDAGADGFALGEGAVALVLKRLADAERDGDPVLGVLRGSAVNHDGPSAGLTAPSQDAQEAVLAKALADAGLAPGDVAYVEAHGTGTPLGDPVEVAALAAVLGRDRREPLRVGSVKTNFGHLEAAAGLLSLLKALLVLDRGQVPPTLHQRAPNPHIPWDAVPVVVDARLRDWPRGGTPRVAGVSAFGMSGTNCHVLVEEAPAPPVVAGPAARPLELYPLSARSEAVLRELAARHAGAVGEAAPLADLAACAALGRAQARFRAAVVAADHAGLREALDALARGDAPVRQVRPGDPPPEVVLRLGDAPGASVPRSLLAEPAFRDAVAEVAGACGHDPLAGDADPALVGFTARYATCRLLLSWGVRPGGTAATGERARAVARALAGEGLAAITRALPREPRPAQEVGREPVVALVLGAADEVLPVLSTGPDTALRDGLTAVARLWGAGVPVAWRAVCRGRRTARLPHYPFQRRALWLPDAPPPPAAERREATMSEVLDSVRAALADLLALPPEEVDPDLPLLELGADSPTFIDLVRRITATHGVRLSVRELFEDLTTARRIAGHVAAAKSGADPAVVSATPTRAPAAGASAGASAEPPAAEPPAAEARAVVAPAVNGRTASPEPAGEREEPVAPAGAPAREPVAEPVAATPPRAPAADLPPPLPAPEPLRAAPAADPRASREGYLRDLVARHHRRTAASLARALETQESLTNNRRSAVGLNEGTAQLRYPIVGARSAGARLWDLDGNEYVDLAMGFGAHLFGHNPDFVVDALRAQLDRGIHLGPEAELSGAVAAKIRALTGVERVNFCTSGTEAVMTALRVARAATGRSTVVLFSNAYHGHFDGTLVNRTPGDPDHAAAPMSPGVVASMVSDVVVLPFNRQESLDHLTEHGGRIAAVVTEPVQNRNPGEHAGPFLRELRRITAEHGALLVMDEVLTGFRVHPAGGQGWFGVRADLVTYGKTLAAGLPMAAVGGRRDLLDLVDGGTWVGPSRLPDGVDPTYTAGTYVKHPLALAAANAVLGRLLDEGPALQERLNERAADLVDDVNDALAALSAPVSIARYGSFFRLVGTNNYSFVHQPVEVEALRTALGHHGAFLVETGTCFLSTAHTDSDVQQVRDAFVGAVTEMRDAGVWDRRPAATTAPRSARAPLPAAPPRLPELSLSYFGDGRGVDTAQHYDLLFDGAAFADEAGLSAIWLPERHFHDLGGFSPNPAVLAAALARQTSRLSLRAGSVVLPLHHPARVAEEWAVVDALSGGRVGLAFASGWNDRDFVLAPGGFATRKQDTLRAMGQVRALWRGDAVAFPGEGGGTTEVRVFPRPVRPELPVWLTALSSEETFAAAGAHGAGVLTNLLNQDVAALRARIAVYREALRGAGHDPASGHVAVLLHTLLGADRDAVRDAAREPLRGYLRAAADLSARLADQTRRVDLDELSAQDRDYLIDAAFRRYADGRSLIGTPEDARPLLVELAAAGVDEVACFVDFGAPPNLVREGFAGIAALAAGPAAAGPGQAGTGQAGTGQAGPGQAGHGLPEPGRDRVVVASGVRTPGPLSPAPHGGVDVPPPAPAGRTIPERVAAALTDVLTREDDAVSGLSARMLAHRVRALAGTITARGVGPGTPVAVLAANDTDRLVAVLAVLLAGGAVLEQPGGPLPRRVGHVVVSGGLRPDDPDRVVVDQDAWDVDCEPRADAAAVAGHDPAVLVADTGGGITAVVGHGELEGSGLPTAALVTAFLSGDPELATASGGHR
ncbi:MupA/Atu3671 family FMN-dependent luciferase-like monooxygenase [Actinosynnema pretiosum]|uniref:MupA/Atu3671 family FMN-dependent luciferase-like monooxygenase n=1 Tax=Actinosynnema pretiosum TaxID=42197 RepID=UPI0015A5783B|nr:MupA/Atu3671 family FMN-dependent luciferase-like monooxygenase [Actinosynnema pretiosum]